MPTSCASPDSRSPRCGTLASDAPLVPYPLLDLRPAACFLEGHLVGATHFNGLLAADGLLHRLYELPPPPVHFHVLASSEGDFEAASRVLSERGHPAPTAIPPSLLSILPPSPDPFSHPIFLPCPLLTASLPLVYSVLLHSHSPPFSALDLASGSGRNATYLLRNNFVVTALDRDPSLISKARSLALNYAPPPHFPTIRTQLQTLGRDLNEDSRWLHQNAVHLLLVVRFLRRGVLQRLPNAVLQGGLVVYEHFLRGCETLGGPKKPSQMLQWGELRDVFSPDKGFVVLRETRDLLADGRPVVRFIAWRKSFC